ncbi:MAG: hypothetical protein Q9168_004466 [Polycauliona sp. 1 TL-2023]
MKVVRKAANKPISPSKESIRGAMHLCDGENHMFDASPLPVEMPLWAASRNKEIRWENLPYLMVNLYWRTRKQMAIFYVFCQLYDMDKVSAMALSTPVRYSRSSDMIRTVSKILACFSQITDLQDPPLRIHATFDIEDFEPAIHWFAAMICRSCDNIDELNDVVDLIEISGQLGRLDKVALQKIIEEHNEAARKKIASRTEDQSKGQAKGKGKDMEIVPLFVGDKMENAAEKTVRQVFGLILPDGTGSNIHQLFDDANTKFVGIENVFKAFFDMTDKELAMMDEDEAFVDL